MAVMSPSVVDSEDNIILDGSTAPTTPEGSLSFSPILSPLRDEDIKGRMGTSRSITTTIMKVATHTYPIRNICCVGAGYVGKMTLSQIETHLSWMDWLVVLSGFTVRGPIDKFLGGPTAAVIAFQNPQIRVSVVDKDPSRIRRWNSHHPPIYEPGLGDIVRIARDGSKECAFVNEPSKSDSIDGLSSASTNSSECGSQCGEHLGGISTVAARQPNLVFSTEVSKYIADADVVLIAVNTPTKSRGAGANRATDMTAFEAVTREVALHARPGAIIVEKSTVPCRTAQLVQEIMATHRPNVPFEVLSNPEFLAAGTAVNDLLHPDRILIGSSPTDAGRRAAESLALVYAKWVPEHRIITTNVWSSELAKLVANSMLAQRISSINSIAAICERTGADVDEIAISIGHDPRIGNKFLKAGIGFGGSCFKKDILSLVYLAESLGLDEVAEYWSQVVKMNEYSRDRFTKRVIKCLNNTLVGKKITIMGYAFKKNTSDTRESPALEIIKSLLEEGPKEIAVFDPCCNPSIVRDEIKRLFRGSMVVAEDGGPLQVYENAYEACNASDAILITTEFDEFRSGPQPSLTSLSQRLSSTGLVSAKRRHIDPRPFERLEPTENDLLALHKFLLSSQGPASSLAADPLQRFQTEPGCAEECPDCVLESDGYRLNEEYRPKERLDWAKISYHMRCPKWVFDGRGVLDVNSMQKLGIRVESVGKQGRS